MFEVPEDGPGCLGTVECVEVNPWSPLLQQTAALGSRILDATTFDLGAAGLHRLDFLEERSGYLGAAHLGDTLDLGNTEDGHDARDDWHLDPCFAAAFNEIEIVGIVKEELCDEKLSSRIDFALEILKIQFCRRTLRVLLGIGSGSDAQLVSLPDETH